MIDSHSGIGPAPSHSSTKNRLTRAASLPNLVASTWNQSWRGCLYDCAPGLCLHQAGLRSVQKLHVMDFAIIHPGGRTIVQVHHLLQEDLKRIFANDPDQKHRIEGLERILTNAQLLERYPTEMKYLFQVCRSLRKCFSIKFVGDRIVTTNEDLQPAIYEIGQFRHWLSQSRMRQVYLADFKRLEEACRKWELGLRLARGSEPQLRIRFASDGDKLDQVIVVHETMKESIKAFYSFDKPSQAAMIDMVLFKKWLTVEALHRQTWPGLSCLNDACDAIISGNLMTVSREDALKKIGEQPFYWSYLSSVVGEGVTARISQDGEFEPDCEGEQFVIRTWEVASDGTGKCTLCSTKAGVIVVNFSVFTLRGKICLKLYPAQGKMLPCDVV